MSTKEEGKDDGNKLSIEESREKRLARVKSKQRDRGGIFKPAESNPLIDILLARDISGRSPSKVKRKSLGRGPQKGHGGTSNPVPATEPQKDRRRKQSSTPTPREADGQKRKKAVRAEDTEIEEERSTLKRSKQCEPFPFVRSYARACAWSDTTQTAYPSCW